MVAFRRIGRGVRGRVSGSGTAGQAAGSQAAQAAGSGLKAAGSVFALLHRPVPAFELDSGTGQTKTEGKTGAYSYRSIAKRFGIHLATVGQIVRGGLQQCEN